MGMDLTMQNFESLIDNVIAGICFFEYENGKLTPFYVNDGMFRMLGYSRTQGMKYINKVEVSIIPEDLPIYYQGIEDVLKDDGAVDVEFRTVTGNGALRWLYVRANLYSREGSKYIIVAIVEDITDRKNVEEELQQQAERLHILSEAAGGKIMDYNAKTDVMVIKASREYDLWGEQILKKYLEHFDESMVHEDDLSYFKSIFRGLLTSPKNETI